jgi:hypothetical protein
MNPMAMKYRFVAVATMGLLGAFTAAAGPLTVVNFSFEDVGAGLPSDSCGTGCFFSLGAIPGWSGSDGTSGQFQPGTQTGNFTHFLTLSDGITNAFSNSATIFQTVGTVAASSMYTLQVDLGVRRNPGFTTFTSSADLLINGNIYLATGIAPTLGNWSTFTVTYTTLAGDAGKPIIIQLRSSGTQAEFDNVRLSVAASAPEPAGFTLFGLGLASLLVFARRKRAS